MTRSPVKNDKTRRKGLFDDGLWKCDCDPRLAAKKIRVQKDNENHGKWFYCCQKDDPKTGGGCGFFLWEEEGRERARVAGFGNAQTRPIPPTTPSTKSKLTSMRTPPIKSFFKAAAQPRVPLSPSPSPGQKHSFSHDDDAFGSDPDLNDINPQVLIDAAVQYEKSPPKSAKIKPATSPGRRRFNGYQDDESEDDDDPFYASTMNDKFATPNSKFRGRDPGVFDNVLNSGIARPGSGSLLTPEKTRTTPTIRTGPPRQPGLAPSALPREPRDESPLRHRSTNLPPSSNTTVEGNIPKVSDFPGPSNYPRSATSSFGHFSSSQDVDPPPATQLSDEILGCLRQLSVELNDMRSVNGVQAISLRFTKRLQAAEKARDISREGIKWRNERISELERELSQIRSEIRGKTSDGRR